MAAAVHISRLKRSCTATLASVIVCTNYSPLPQWLNISLICNTNGISFFSSGTDEDAEYIATKYMLLCGALSLVEEEVEIESSVSGIRYCVGSFAIKVWLQS